jgi:hypothetical protein
MYYDFDKDCWHCSTCHINLKQLVIDYNPDCAECDSAIYTLLVSDDHDASAS